MGWVTMSCRLLYIQQELNNIEWQIDQICRQKMSLQKYSSAISDGKIGFLELAGMPLEYQGMAMQYIMGGQMGAMQSAAGWAIGMGQMMQQQGANVPQPYVYMMYQKALEERLKQSQKAEEARIKEIEQQLDYKMKKLETRQKALDKEYESVEKRVEKDIDRTTPKYA